MISLIGWNPIGHHCGQTFAAGLLTRQPNGLSAGCKATASYQGSRPRRGNAERVRVANARIADLRC